MPEVYLFMTVILLLYLLWMPLNKFRDEVAIKEIQRVLIPNRHAILSGPTELLVL
jgi:hypothetical protein